MAIDYTAELKEIFGESDIDEYPVTDRGLKIAALFKDLDERLKKLE